jgi:hypothetical protein
MKKLGWTNVIWENGCSGRSKATSGNIIDGETGEGKGTIRLGTKSGHGGWRGP